LVGGGIEIKANSAQQLDLDLGLSLEIKVVKIL
jgi:hypothetical protein